MTENGRTTFVEYQQLTDHWTRLTQLMRDQLIHSLGDKDQHGRYMLLLNEIRADRSVLQPDGTIEKQLGLYRAPASKDYHHQQEGGLLAHLLEMWDLWLELGHTIRIQTGGESRGCHPLLTDRLVWLAIFHHDLNKIWRYQVIDEFTTFQVDYATDELDDLLAPNGKSLFLLQKHGIQLPIILMNALLASEGGYNERRPHGVTVLAKTVYLLDELSANVINRIHNHRFWNGKVRDVV